jgi:hypothetical protein
MPLIRVATEVSVATIGEFAAVHAYLGEKDRAFEWLERAFQKRASFRMPLRSNNYFDHLREDWRFDALVKRTGIPD